MFAATHVLHDANEQESHSAQTDVRLAQIGHAPGARWPGARVSGARVPGALPATDPSIINPGLSTVHRRAGDHRDNGDHTDHSPRN